MISNQESLNLITQDWRTKKEEFEFNKDAGMYVCKAGHLAIRTDIHIILTLENVKPVRFEKVVTLKMRK